MNAQNPRVGRFKILGDLIRFQIKLVADGLKDIILSPLSIAATAIDFLFPRSKQKCLLYRVLLMGSRAERWVGLFDAVKTETENDLRLDELLNQAQAKLNREELQQFQQRCAQWLQKKRKTAENSAEKPSKAGE